MPPALVPAPAEITAASLLDASRSGHDALRRLLRGPEQAPLTRTEQVARTREALRLLPALQITIEQRRLVATVTRQILQQLLDEVTTESQNQVGEQLEKLQKEQKALLEARAEVQKQEQQDAPPPSPAPLPPSPLSAWQWFRSAPTAVQAAVIGAGALAVVGIRKLWKKIHWTIRTVLIAVGGYLGILWLLRHLGIGGGGSLPGNGPGNLPGTPPVLPASPVLPPAQEPPPAPGQGLQPPEGSDVLLPRQYISVRVLGPESIERSDEGWLRYFLVSGVAEPMDHHRLNAHVRGTFQQGRQPIVVLNVYDGSTDPMAWRPPLNRLFRNTEENQNRGVYTVMIHRRSDGSVRRREGNVTFPPEIEPVNQEYPLAMDITVLRPADAMNDPQGHPRCFLRGGESPVSHVELIAQVQRLRAERLRPQLRLRFGRASLERGAPPIAAIQKACTSMGLPCQLDAVPEQPLPLLLGFSMTDPPVGNDASGNARRFTWGLSGQTFSEQELITLIRTQQHLGFAPRVFVHAYPFREDSNTFAPVRKAMAAAGIPLVIR